MTLQKDLPRQPRPPRTIVWIVTIALAGACLVAAIVIAIVEHVKLF
jgi:hypothetical protein